MARLGGIDENSGLSRASALESRSSPVLSAGLALAAVLIAAVTIAAEQPQQAGSPDWLQLSPGMAGGLALFLGGLLALPAGIALAFGANIGSAVTTALLGILSSKSTEAVRASVVHVTFNVLGVLIWLPLIDLLADILVWASTSSPELAGPPHARGPRFRARSPMPTPSSTCSMHSFLSALPAG
jgi:hypothetical protein